MSGLPAPVAILVGVLVLAGACLALIGAIGLVKLKNFYARVHAPTLTTTLGIFLILVASMLAFSVAERRLVLHELVLMALLLVTTPVSLLLLVRAGLFRDRNAGSPYVPAPPKAAERRGSKP